MTTTERMGFCLIGVLMVASLGCNGTAPGEQRTIEAATIRLQIPDEVGQFPEQFDDSRRPAVEYKHEVHVKALEAEECKACHQYNEQGELIPKFMRKEDLKDRDALMELYHDKCVDCHQQKSAEGQKHGPFTCGECHVKQPEPVLARMEMRFDYSLHYRHTRAFEEKCENCHHTYNEEKKKLEYVKGTESNCWDCHLEMDQGNNLSRKNAAHTDCVGCHLKRKDEKQKGGPWLCLGCHSQEGQAKIEKAEKVKRLDRKQPDMVWIRAPEAKSQLVSFNHEFHEQEPQTSSCRACHHQTLRPCRECHRLTPATNTKGADGDSSVDEGGGVALEAAYHLASSEYSCTGCHKTQTDKKNCSGCHWIMDPPPSERACPICHSGPEPAKAPKKLADPVAKEIELDPVPVISDDFPEKVVIGVLTEKYKPAELPHHKIVTHLDKLVRESKLASWFHSYPETMCAGCHHESPIGKRPTPCRSCHDETGQLVEDRPGLFTAYHRKCMGCHMQMDIKKQECTDCHEKVSKEVVQ